MSLIDDLIELSQMISKELPESALEKTRLSLLDWMVCGWAGKNEPLADKLRQLAGQELGVGQSSIIGGGKGPARMAALVNGATSHALDYDDTHFAHVGHLSVGIYPAALAVAEETGSSASHLIEAFLVGAEAAIRVGMKLGPSHYNLGFHQTATAGAFGATVAAGRLYGLSPMEMRHALGLCATRASGLKCQFGTMGKPYNAGIAASNAVECAKLAAFGFTSAEDGLTGPQGFISTHTGETGVHDTFSTPPGEIFFFEENKYKLHACCHGTHAMIEALRNSKKAPGNLDRIAAVLLHTNPRWLKVCDIKAPKTGLEVKFSYAWLAGMILRGDKTDDDHVYTDDLALDPELMGFSSRFTVVGDNEISDMQARIDLTLVGGETLSLTHDLDSPQSNLLLKDRLIAKAISAIGDKGQEIWRQLEHLDAMTAHEIGKMISDG
jgi:2-methylcitrate dehydratase PrpD